MQSIDIVDGQLWYWPDFFDQTEQMQLYQGLSHSLTWRQDDIVIFGRRVAIPRLQAWYSDAGIYGRYSGIALAPQPWTDSLWAIKQRVDQLGYGPFNSVLANWYRHGLDKMGYHCDDEKELGFQPTIVSISLGCQRKFSLKHKYSGERVSLDLPGGSLLIMAENTQTFWKHSVPAQKRIREGRLNLTFRQVVG